MRDRDSFKSVEEAKMKIGFIGLGSMGKAMATVLLQQNYDLIVYNRTRSAADELEKAGAQVASSPAEVARQCEVVITMLANDEAVEAVTLGNDGLSTGLARDAIHISMSSISPNLSKQLAQSHTQAGQGYFAAPVFGRPDVAAKGNLWIVAGGDNAQIEHCRSILEAMSRGISIIGTDPSLANLVKITGNFTITAMMETLGEVFALMQKSGIEPQDFLQIVNQVFQSPLYENYGTQIIQKRFDPALFTLKLGLKDIRLVREVADDVAVPMPLVNLVYEHMLAAIAHGQAEQDWASFTQVNAENAGLK